MNPIYIAACLTPFLGALIKEGVSTWFENPQLAPPGLFKMGVIGQLYKLSIVFIIFAAQFSLIGLLFAGDVSLLSAIGLFVLGIISGGLWISLGRNILVINLLVENLITPGILSVNLFIVHWIAWSAQ